MPRTARDVVFVDGAAHPFGKAGPNGLFAETRADDLMVRVSGTDAATILRGPRTAAARWPRPRHRDRGRGPDHRPFRRGPGGPAASVPGSATTGCARAR